MQRGIIGPNLGYTRVSKGEEQNTALQRKALEAAEVERIFDEKASGAWWDRPELQRLRDQLRSGDVVVVWKLDCLSRSLKDLVILMERIDKAGAGFRSLTEIIDTTTPVGRIGGRPPILTKQQRLDIADNVLSGR